MSERQLFPDIYNGPLAQSTRYLLPSRQAAEEVRWFRAQMRRWARWWRERRDAGQPAGTSLALAVSYRDGALRREETLKSFVESLPDKVPGSARELGGLEVPFF